jgi:hypothetical protein
MTSLSVSAFSLSSLPDLSSLETLLTCPVSFELLTDAVTALPCGHNFNAHIIEILQSERSDPPPCPLCRGPISSVVPALLIKEIASRVLESKMVREAPSRLLRYPGKGAIFVEDPSELGWAVIPAKGAGKLRSMKFRSKKATSLLQIFSIMGYRSGGIKVMIDYKIQDKDTVIKYLRDLEFCDLNNGTFQFFETAKEIRKIYKVVSENNELPADKLPLIRSLVEAYSWTSVTPLTKEEQEHCEKTYGF